MTIDLLKLKQLVYGKNDFEPIYEGLNGENHLSRSSPAKVIDGKIYILDILSPTEKEEAKAHELGHELIKGRGMIRCEAYNELDDGKLFLFGEINNSLSHKELISTLSSEFNLSSGLHLQLQLNALLYGGIEQKIANCSNDKFGLYAIGLELFDIQRTVEGNYDEEIRKLCTKSIYVKKGLEVGTKYLDSINLNSTREEQIKALACVMTEFELGHLLDINYYYPLPIEIYCKEEDISHLMLNEIKSIFMKQAQK